MAAAPMGGPQAPGFSRFKVGEFEVVAVHDGIAVRDLPKGFVRGVQDADVVRAYEEIGVTGGKLANTFTALAINTGKQVILIDTGFADNGGPTTGRISANLQAAGIAPRDVDIVLLSHFHGDHISGLKLKDGSDAYPNAKIMVPALEWAFWTDDARASAAPEGMKGAFALVKKNLGGLGDRLVRYEHGKDVIPGIAPTETLQRKLLVDNPMRLYWPDKATA